MACNFCYAPLTLTLDGTGWECKGCKDSRWPTMPALELEVIKEERPPIEEIEEAA